MHYITTTTTTTTTLLLATHDITPQSTLKKVWNNNINTAIYNLPHDESHLQE